MTEETLKTTPLNANHRARGARMVGFGGYDMPVQYEGVLAEHRWTREHAGLFDVSHMGQCRISGDDAVAQFERFVPGDYAVLKAGRQKYSLLLNAEGGIMDDLMAGKPDHDGLYVVVNAGNKDADFAFLQANLEGDAKLTVLADRALIVQQQGVFLTARLQDLIVAGQEALELRHRVRARQPGLAHVRNVEQARMLAGPAVLGQNPFVLHRHVIARERHHARAQRPVSGVQRRGLEGLVSHGHAPAGVGRRRIGRSFARHAPPLS